MSPTEKGWGEGMSAAKPERDVRRRNVDLARQDPA